MISEHQKKMLNSIKEHGHESVAHVGQDIDSDIYESIGYGCRKVGDSFIIKNNKMYYSVYTFT